MEHKNKSWLEYSKDLKRMMERSLNLITLSQDDHQKAFENRIG
jgi:hypothetical protein